MDFYHFVGIDISKDTLDWAVYTQQQGIILSIQTDNTLDQISLDSVESTIRLELGSGRVLYGAYRSCATRSCTF